MAVRIDRYAHVRLTVTDIDRARAFYDRVLGLEVAFELPDDAEECDSDADRTADRAANWLALHEIVQSLYGAFLKERLQEDYRTTGAEAQAAWMAR